MRHICVSRLTITGSDNGLSPGRRQAIIVNWTLRKKLQWNFDQKCNIFIHKNAFESIVCEMASILSRPQCVKRTMRVANQLLEDFRQQHQSRFGINDPRLFCMLGRSTLYGCLVGTISTKNKKFSVHLWDRDQSLEMEISYQKAELARVQTHNVELTLCTYTGIISEYNFVTKIGTE